MPASCRNSRKISRSPMRRKAVTRKWAGWCQAVYSGHVGKCTLGCKQGDSDQVSEQNTRHRWLRVVLNSGLLSRTNLAPISESIKVHRAYQRSVPRNQPAEVADSVVTATGSVGNLIVLSKELRSYRQGWRLKCVTLICCWGRQKFPLVS